MTPRRFRAAASLTLALLIAAATASAESVTAESGSVDTFIDTTADQVAGELSEDKRYGPINVQLWRGGKKLREFWFESDDPEVAHDAPADDAVALLTSGLRDATGLLAAAQKPNSQLLVCMTHSWTPKRRIRRGDHANVHRGMRGVALHNGQKAARYCPSYAIRTNRKLERVIELFDRDVKSVEARFFLATELLIDANTASATRLYRSQTLIPASAVTRNAVEQLNDNMAGWLLRNIQHDGRMTYKYWPSSGRESTANNMIRQFMATTALGRYRCYQSDDTLAEPIARNLKFNIASFYRQEENLGLIEYNNTVKLGAVALAGLAILENPAASKYRDMLVALLATTDALILENGRFRTFYKPAKADRNHNFYPGEALLFWSYLLTGSSEHCGTLSLPEDDREQRLAHFQRAVDYYRTWHLDKENRNPAFIPWHTQAIYRVYANGDERPEDREYLFLMNDWLIEVMQQWNRAPASDTRGRFYAAGNRYGPPHASSTAVYLEGLIDAFRLARQSADRERTARYRQAIKRGLRSLMQLQFRDGIDMFYIQQQERVRGGMRTTVYHNELRVDNVQHALMATMKILTHFSEEDWDADDMD